jgi:hypothetical protein
MDDSSQKLITPMPNYFLKLLNIKFSPTKRLKYRNYLSLLHEHLQSGVKTKIMPEDM